jgi:murein DD-endopeptidase MepM/ murein hydrolase activator NlpD
MKMGSVRVRTGDTVTAGQPLGLIGMSGAAEFPHVHFTVRLSGQAVDPFVGAAPGAPCRAPRTPLWSAAALHKLGYVATG